MTTARQRAIENIRQQQRATDRRMAAVNRWARTMLFLVVGLAALAIIFLALS